MIPRNVSIALALALTTVGGTASATPQWCKSEGKNDFHRTKTPYAGDDVEKALDQIVRDSCAADDDIYGATLTPALAAQIAASRATWSKILGMTEADWADVLDWQGTSQRVRAIPFVKLDRKQAWSKLDAIDQYASMLPLREHAHYVADALGTRLTETGRLGYLQVCLQSTVVGEWAICQADLEALDTAKLATELRADKTHSGFQRMLVRIELHATRKRIAARTAEVATLVAKDPGYAKLFAVAATARKAWVTNPPDAALLELVGAMDDARVTNSNAAFAGCQDTTWAPFSSGIGRIPAKTFAAINPDGAAFLYGSLGLLTTDRDMYLASAAFFLCRRIENPADPLVRFLGITMQRWPGFRGPRNAAHTVMLTTEIKLDDRDARIKFPEINRNKDSYGDLFSGDASMHGGGAGVVAAVVPEGDNVRVEFVKKLVKIEFCDNWQSTGKIIGVEAGGGFRYEQVCKSSKFETVNQAPTPRVVNKRYATGVKPGVHASLLENIVLTVRPKAGAQPSHVFGVPVK